MELCHVVAEAQAQLRVFLDEEVDDAHDALGRFVKGVGRGVALAHHQQHAAAVGRLAREKAIEEEAREVKPEIDSALTAAQQPGTPTTRMPFSTAARMSSLPGSEMQGVPASVMTAMSLPEASCR